MTPAGATLYMTTMVRSPDRTRKSSCGKDGLENAHIYIKEVVAFTYLVAYICERYPGYAAMIAEDNTAATCAINRGYSSNQVANRFIAHMYATLRQHSCSATAIRICGPDTVADQASRGDELQLKREQKTWQVLLDYEHGRIHGADTPRVWSEHKRRRDGEWGTSLRHEEPQLEDPEEGEGAWAQDACDLLQWLEEDIS